MNNAMIGYGNSLMPPFCGKRNYLVHSAGRVHCRHLGVQMQLHTLVLGGIHAAFDVAAVNIHGEHAVIPRIGVIPIVASDQKGGSVALSFFQQGYGSLLLHRLRKELDGHGIGLIRYENGDHCGVLFSNEDFPAYHSALHYDFAGLIVQLRHGNDLRLSYLLAEDDILGINMFRRFFLPLPDREHRRTRVLTHDGTSVHAVIEAAVHGHMYCGIQAVVFQQKRTEFRC